MRMRFSAASGAASGPVCGAAFGVGRGAAVRRRGLGRARQVELVAQEGEAEGEDAANQLRPGAEKARLVPPALPLRPLR